MSRRARRRFRGRMRGLGYFKVAGRWMRSTITEENWKSGDFEITLFNETWNEL